MPITPTPPTLSPSQRSAPLRLYAGILLALWTISALPFVIHSPHLWPTTPLWLQPPFYDFGCYFDRLKLLHQPAFWTTPGITWDYPAPCVLVYQLFYAFNRPTTGDHKVFYGFLAYLLFAALVLLFAGYQLTRAMHRRGVPTLHATLFFGLSLPLCWPIYFSLQRGNIDFFLDAGIALGLWAYIQRKWWLAAAVLGVFGACKLYPLLLLLLLLPPKRWKPFLLGIAAAVTTTFLSTRWIGPAPAVAHQSHGIVQGIFNWVHANSLTLNLHLSGFDHSIFGALKLLNLNHPQRFVSLAISYAVVAAIGMALLLTLRIRKQPRPNQLLAVLLAAVLLPPTSFDYTLMLLLPAWAWLLLLVTGPQATLQLRRAAPLLMVAFALLFAPETFATWHGIFFAAQLKLLCLLLLLAVASIIPLAEEPLYA